MRLPCGRREIDIEELIDELRKADALEARAIEEAEELLLHDPGGIARPLLELSEKLAIEQGESELVDALLLKLQSHTKGVPHLLSRDVLRRLASNPRQLSDQSLASVILMMARSYPTDIPNESLSRILELTEYAFQAKPINTCGSREVLDLLHELWGTIAGTSLSSLISILRQWSYEIGWNRVSCLFFAELIAHAAPLQPQEADNCIALFEEIASRQNDPGVKEVSPNTYADEIKRLSVSHQAVSNITSREVRSQKRITGFLVLTTLILPAAIAAYRVPIDSFLENEGALSLLLSFGAEFCIALLYLFSFAFLFFTVAGWIKTLRIMGVGSVYAIPRMLKLRDACKFSIWPSARRNPWWVNLTVQSAVIWLVFFLSARLSSPLLFAVASAGVIVAVVRLLDAARPPGVLLLGPSTVETLMLQSAMNSMSRNCRVVSLLDVNRLDLNIGLSSWAYTGTVFRTFRDDPDLWFSTVQQLARTAPLIVLDARHPSRPVLQEMRWVLQSKCAYKLVCILGDDGHAAVLDWMDASRTALGDQGVLLVSERELYEVLGEFMKSAQCLPSSDLPASQISRHDRVGKSGRKV